MPAIDDNRLLALDVARGIAALCVVLFHWSHFIIASGQTQIVPSDYPLYDFLAPIYEAGWLGVEFFFVLSGAIFFSKYKVAISERAITGWQFFILRFSRLYPLHFVTLILVAVLQGVLFSYLGHFVIYQDNDAAHFVANALFVQDWSFTPFLSDVSFNAPAWSLSVEVFLYLAFFVLVRYLPTNALVLVSIALLGLWLKSAHLNVFLGRGLWCFFIGGIIALHCTRLRPVIGGGGAAVLLALTVVEGRGEYLKQMTSNAELIILINYVLHTALFASIVGLLIVSDKRLRKIAKRLVILGDISYASYMLHFPLQLSFILIFVTWTGAYDLEPFRSPWMLALFMTFLVAASLLTFRLFEVPARKLVRSRLLKHARTLHNEA